MLKFLFLCLLSATACASGEKDKYSSLGTVPLLLNKHMKKMDCSPISNFYSNYMVTEPPFVWLDSSGFAFVCENKKSDSDFDYTLVVKNSVKKDFFDSCPVTVSLLAKPGGLLLESRVIEKDNFVRVAGNVPLKYVSQKKLPILVLPTGTGGYTEYVCVSGSWYFYTYS